MLRYDKFLTGAKKAASPVYVLAGAEAFLRSEAETALVKVCLGADTTGLIIYDKKTTAATQVEPGEIFDELRSSSLFTSKKVVVLREGGAFLKEHGKVLLEYLKAPDSESILILHVAKWDKRTAMAKKFDAWAVDCAPPYEANFGESAFSPSSPLGRWITTHAKQKYKLELAPDATLLLVEYVGTHLAELDATLNKLSSLLGSGGKTKLALGVEEIEANVTPTRSFAQFKVAELAVSGDIKSAFAAMDACFENGLPNEQGKLDYNKSSIASRILWSIGREFELRYRAAGAIVAGKSVKASAGMIGIIPFKADEVERSTRKLGPGRLSRAVRMCFEAEVGIKSGLAEPRLALEKLLMQLGDIFKKTTAV